jgi:hypothetical protein
MDNIPDCEVIWVSFFFQSSVSLLGVAAQLGKHLQGTMLFMKLGLDGHQT